MTELLLVLIGAIAAFLGTRIVDRAAARRKAYARFFGPAEMLAWDLVRRMVAIKDHAHPVPVIPDSRALNEPMGEVAIVGSEVGLELVNGMVATLNSMIGIADQPARARERLDDWDQLLSQYGEQRRMFLQRARRESAMWPLSKRFFEGTRT